MALASFCSACSDETTEDGETSADDAQCVIHIYDVDGAEPGPSTLTVPAPRDGYWLASFNLALVGTDDDGHTFQLWGEDIDTLGSGDALPLVPTVNDGGDGARVVLRWFLPGAIWASTSGTLVVVAYEPGPPDEPQPAHFEVVGAQMAPSPEQGTGEAMAGDATGTFTMDLSCRVEKFSAP